MITIEQMIQREIMCCMSSMVSTLDHGHALSSGPFNKLCGLADLILQAHELAAPVLDYEEAATQEGYKVETIGENDWQYTEPNGDVHGGFHSYDEACANAGIDPYEWEVYEHWAVSTWLAEKLVEQGEKVDTDFAGLNIWARTCTGQAVSMDGCMERIYKTMMSPVGASA